jgi:hypothetical protein
MHEEAKQQRTARTGRNLLFQYSAPNDLTIVLEGREQEGGNVKCKRRSEGLGGSMYIYRLKVNGADGWEMKRKTSISVMAGHCGCETTPGFFGHWNLMERQTAMDVAYGCWQCPFIGVGRELRDRVGVEHDNGGALD